MFPPEMDQPVDAPTMMFGLVLLYMVIIAGVMSGLALCWLAGLI